MTEEQRKAIEDASRKEFGVWFDDLFSDMKDGQIWENYQIRNIANMAWQAARNQSNNVPVGKVIATERHCEEIGDYIDVDVQFYAPLNVAIGEELYTSPQQAIPSGTLAVALEALAWADGKLNSDLIKRAISKVQHALTQPESDGK